MSNVFLCITFSCYNFCFGYTKSSAFYNSNDAYCLNIGVVELWYLVHSQLSYWLIDWLMMTDWWLADDAYVILSENDDCWLSLSHVLTWLVLSLLLWPLVTVSCLWAFLWSIVVNMCKTADTLCEVLFPNQIWSFMFFASYIPHDISGRTFSRVWRKAAGSFSCTLIFSLNRAMDNLKPVLIQLRARHVSFNGI